MSQTQTESGWEQTCRRTFSILEYQNCECGNYETRPKCCQGLSAHSYSSCESANNASDTQQCETTCWLYIWRRHENPQHNWGQKNRKSAVCWHEAPGIVKRGVWVTARGHGLHHRRANVKAALTRSERNTPLTSCLFIIPLSSVPLIRKYNILNSCRDSDEMINTALMSAKYGAAVWRVLTHQPTLLPLTKK